MVIWLVQPFTQDQQILANCTCVKILKIYTLHSKVVSFADTREYQVMVEDISLEQ